MKNLLILILFLAAITFGGKVFVEKKYESKLDDAIALTRGFVDLRYGDIKIDFDGSVTINGLSITPPGLDESVDIQSIRAISSDRLFPLKGLDIFADGKFPETFEVSISQLSLPIELADESKGIYLENLPKGQECRSLMASLNYADAGYSRIEADVRVGFDFSDSYNAVINVDQFDQAASVTFELVFDANRADDLFLGQTTQLPVSEINATFELEPDAAQRFVAQCASVFKVTPEIYLEKVVGSVKYSENSFGADLGPEMREALVTFMQGGAKFSLRSTPDLQLKKLDQFQFYKAKDILRWMNLKLELDGESLTLTASELEADKADDQATPEAIKPKYSRASASQATSYIGRWVRIKRSNERKPLEGTLTGIDKDSRLMVEMYQFGGLMTQTVGTEEIESFDVLNK